MPKQSTIRGEFGFCAFSLTAHVPKPNQLSYNPRHQLTLLVEQQNVPLSRWPIYCEHPNTFQKKKKSDHPNKRVRKSRITHYERFHIITVIELQSLSVMTLAYAHLKAALRPSSFPNSIANSHTELANKKVI